MRALLLVASLPILALAGCLEDAPVEPSANVNLTTPVANVTLPEEVVLAIGTTGQWPVNPGFSPEMLEAKEGTTINLTFSNKDASAPVLGVGTPHDWVLEGVEGAATDQIGPGESATVTFAAPAVGEYTYYCSVGDHRERGMEGMLMVTAAS